MATTLARIEFRRKTAAQWTSSNEVLLASEPGVETDTGKWKFGDGTTAWSALPYQAPTAASLSATSTTLWKANTAYAAGQAVVNPSGFVVTALANFTSGSSYSASNWNDPTASTYAPYIAQLEAVPFLREGDSYDDGSQGADQASRPFARLAARHNMGTVTKTSVQGTRMDQILARVIANAVINRRGLIGLSDCLINDMLQFGAASTGQTTSREAFRTLLAYLSSQAVSTITGTAIHFGPGWTTGSTSTAGAYVDLSFSTATAYALINFVTTTGGTATIKNAAGTTVATVSTGGYQQAFVGAVKLTGTAGQTTTYRLAVTSGTIAVVGVAPQSPTPGLVVWDKAGALLSAPNSTLLAAYQATCSAILTDFPNVLPVDMGAGWNVSTMISTEDGVHRNDLGTQYALTQIEAALRTKLAGTGLYQGFSRLGAPGSAAVYTDPTALYSGPGATAPTAAPTLTVPATSDVTATLAFTQPNDGGATITGFKVQYRVTSVGGAWTAYGTTFSGSAAQGVVTGLAATTQYDFQVAAVNSVGQGAWSTTVTGTTIATVVTYAADSFTRADSTTVAGTTETGGYTWVGTTGTIGINSNRLSCVTGSNVTALIDDGHSDGTVSITRHSIGAMGLAFRMSSDSLTGYVVWMSGATLTLSKRTGTSSYSSLGTFALTSEAADPNMVVTAILNGSSINILVNGVSRITVTDATYSGTRHGMWGQYTPCYADDFSHTSATS